jgi:hypothetical protein
MLRQAAAQSGMRNSTSFKKPTTHEEVRASNRRLQYIGEFQLQETTLLIDNKSQLIAKSMMGIYTIKRYSLIPLKNN